LSHNLSNLDLFLSSILAFIAFSLCASATYIINDLFDLQEDRTHQTKSARPFASGDIKISNGIFMAAVLAVASAVFALFVNNTFFYMLFLYVVCTLSYSMWIKRLVLVDVFMLALLYTLRIFSGSIAIEITESLWLLSFSIFIFLSLALIKRYAELRSAIDYGKTALIGRNYRHDDLLLLMAMGISFGSIAALILLIYISNSASSLLYTSPHVLWIIALIILFWISRAWLLTMRGEMNEDPVFFALKDKASIACAILVAIVLMLAV
jgi:4-hydroxybenzoate polyprenyltransferase